MTVDWADTAAKALLDFDDVYMSKHTLVADTLRRIRVQAFADGMEAAAVIAQGSQPTGALIARAIRAVKEGP